VSRVEPESNLAAALAPPQSAAVFPAVPDDELETPPLPREHPKWVKDALAVSSRARQIIARLRPVAVRILTFWDHHVRGVAVAGRRLTVDISGSYRVD
jgi:hypothetical protein